MTVSRWWALRLAAVVPLALFAPLDLPKNQWSWDCEANGLIVSPGDKVAVRIHGTAM